MENINSGIRRERHIYCSELVQRVNTYGMEGFLETQGVESEQLNLYREK